ncbi:hypothetical protein [Dickeya phage Amaethon]|nr:hypothetical protein [Dickeya phage Amaethon]
MNVTRKEYHTTEELTPDGTRIRYHQLLSNGQTVTALDKRILDDLVDLQLAKLNGPKPVAQVYNSPIHTFAYKDVVAIRSTSSNRTNEGHVLLKCAADTLYFSRGLNDVRKGWLNWLGEKQ